MRGATRTSLCVPQVAHISIHAPHAGGDKSECPVNVVGADFNPRPPCGGRRCRRPKRRRRPRFQSTPPMRGATVAVDPSVAVDPNFNPRPPCGGRPAGHGGRRQPYDFNPRPPCGGRPSMPQASKASAIISIHAPHAGGDAVGRWVAPSPNHFNPRPPCGGRRGGTAHGVRYARDFNPRPPCGGRRRPSFPARCSTGISIHAPHAGGDVRLAFPVPAVIRFQSTPPMRGATAKTAKISSCFHNKIGNSFKIPLLTPI